MLSGTGAYTGDLFTGKMVEGEKRERVLNLMTLKFPFNLDFP